MTQPKLYSPCIVCIHKRF